MNERDKDALVEYIRTVADEMALREWAFILSDEQPSNTDAYASVCATEGRRVAVIRLCEDFRALKPGDQRNSIVHELLHCHHDAQTDTIRLTLPKLLRQAEYEVVWESFRLQTEYMVDLLASAIEKHMPLIEWPEVEEQAA